MLLASLFRVYPPEVKFRKCNIIEGGDRYRYRRLRNGIYRFMSLFLPCLFRKEMIDRRLRWALLSGLFFWPDGIIR